MSSSNGKKATVLYFEDDMASAAMVSEFLQMSDFEVVHFDRYPAEGIDAIRQALSGEPDIVLVDIRLPGVDGYQVCRELRKGLLSAQTPILITSGLMEEDDILKAYEAGAQDYLTKPLRLHELVHKINQICSFRQDRFAMSRETEIARKLAFDAMKSSSELGNILRFHESIHSLRDLPSLASLTFDVIASFNLQSALVFFTGKDEYFRDDSCETNIELESIIAARSKGRLYSWKNFSFFNYDTFTLLIRNMPVHDLERYGVLKDLLCLLANGIDARLKAMMVEKSNEAKQRNIRIVAKTLAAMVMEMEQYSSQLSAEFEKIIVGMETDITADLIQFNLLEHEETTMMSHVRSAIEKTSQLFESSLERERQYKNVMSQLLKDLAS